MLKSRYQCKQRKLQEKLFFLVVLGLELRALHFCFSHPASPWERLFSSGLKTKEETPNVHRSLGGFFLFTLSLSLSPFCHELAPKQLSDSGGRRLCMG
jgi:hypothetical protein